MINLRKTLFDAHSVLEHAGIAHALIGGFALAAYGQHRLSLPNLDLEVVKKYADLFNEWSVIEKLRRGRS